MKTASHYQSSWLVRQHTPTATTTRWQPAVRPAAVHIWRPKSSLQPMACSLRSLQTTSQPAGGASSRCPLPAQLSPIAACGGRNRLGPTNATGSDRAAPVAWLPQSVRVFGHELQLPVPQHVAAKQQQLSAKQVKKVRSKDVATSQQPAQHNTVSQLPNNAQQQKVVKQVKKVAAHQEPVQKRPPPEITHFARLVHPSTAHHTVQQLGTQPQKRFKLAKQLQLMNAPARAPTGLSMAGPAGWAALIAVAMGVYGITRLAFSTLTGQDKQQRYMLALRSDHTHLQSLAAAAAAATTGSDGLLTVPGSLVGGALQEVQQHALQLAAVKEQAGMLAKNAASVYEQLAESLRESEENLAQALQTVHALESELSEVGSLLESQESVLSSLTGEAAAVAAAHRSSLAVSQRKVALLESTVDMLQQRLKEAAAAEGQSMLGGLPEAAIAVARAELAAQVEALRGQLEHAQGRLAAAESRASELEGQLQLLTDAQQELGNRLAALERDATAAATAVKEAVQSAERCLATLAADHSAGTPIGSMDAVGDDIAALQDSIAAHEAQLLSLQRQLLHAQQAAQPSTDGAAQQQQPDSSADSRQLVLSAAVAAKAIELEGVRHQLEHRLEQARSSSTARQSEVSRLLADASNQLAAARQAAEDKRAELAAIKGSMGSMFSQLMGQLDSSSSAAAVQVAQQDPQATSMQTMQVQQEVAGNAEQQQQQQAGGVGDEGASKAAAAALKAQLSLIEAAAGASQQELDLLLSIVKISLSPEQQANIDRLQPGSSSDQPAASFTPNEQVLQLLRGSMNAELQAREASLRQELAQLQQQAAQAREQLAQIEPPQPTVEEIAVAAAAQAAAEAELRAKLEAEAQAAAEAQALAAKAKAMLQAKTQAALKAKADAEARATREAAAAAQRQAKEEDRAKAAAEARATAELEAKAVANAREAAAAKAREQEAARAAAKAKAAADGKAAADAAERQRREEQERQAAAAAEAERTAQAKAAAEAQAAAVERQQLEEAAAAAAKAAAAAEAAEAAQAAEVAQAAETKAQQEAEAKAAAAADAEAAANAKAAAEQTAQEKAQRQAAAAEAEAAAAAAAEVAAAQQSVAAILAEADTAMQAVEQQQPEQQAVGAAEQLSAQLRVLAAAQGLLEQQAEQLTAVQARCEVRLADSAATEAEEASRELADLQMSLAERQAALAQLAAALEARLRAATQAAAAAQAAAAKRMEQAQSTSSSSPASTQDPKQHQQQQQKRVAVSSDSYDEPQQGSTQQDVVLSMAQKLLDQGLGALTSSSSSNSSNDSAGNSSSSSSSKVLSPPLWDSAGKAAVLFLGKVAGSNKQQQQGPSSPAQAAPTAADSDKQDADDVLLLAQKLLDKGLGALTGNGSSGSSSDGNQEGPEDGSSRGGGGGSSSSSSRNGVDRHSVSPAAPGGRSSPAPPAALPATAAAAGVASAVAATQLAPSRPATPMGWKAPKRQQLRLKSAGVLLPHPAKVKTGGEDAFFVSRAGCGCLGVADGVGSWAADGVDAAAYAEGLMAAAADACERSNGSEGPRQVLAYAQKHNAVAGSCTCLVAVLKPSNILDVCLVGDTGLRVVRGGQVVMATEVQEHAFNTPFQLAHLSFLPNADTAGMGLAYSVPVAPGDVLVAGSDGLFDNVWDEQLADMVTQGIRSLSPSSGNWDTAAAAHLARRIAEVAAAQAADRQFKSPWAVEVAERVPQAQTLMSRLFGPRGGKLDDITVVVALVT